LYLSFLLFLFDPLFLFLLFLLFLPLDLWDLSLPLQLDPILLLNLLHPSYLSYRLPCKSKDRMARMAVDRVDGAEGRAEDRVAYTH
jgi:hypothetical protein